ncbi:MAG: WbqC family protein [Planctomycetes bacterium]|nr:WbqC family protein [Planctomycetota bacterium]
MIVTGHQPNYLPYPGFFQKVASSDLFVIVDTVQFVKRGPFGWIHRNRIRTPEGWTWLSVPVVTKGLFAQAIRDCAIDRRLPWRRKHWRTIERCYRRAPHWGEHAPFLERLYGREWDRLAPFAEEGIRYILSALGIDVPIVRLSDIGASGRATDLIIDFCRRLGASAYLSGVHGRDYLEVDRFREAGIALLFQEYAPPLYPQCHPGAFVPNLSMLDMLLCSGERAAEWVREGRTVPTT